MIGTTKSTWLYAVEEVTQCFIKMYTEWFSISIYEFIRVGRNLVLEQEN